MGLCEATRSAVVLLVKCRSPSVGSVLFGSVQVHCGISGEAASTVHRLTEFAVKPQVKFDTGLRLTLTCVSTMSLI